MKIQVQGSRVERLGGFTLIELLVVISIISLMMALVVPSYTESREVGRRTVCASNQRQTLVTHNTYAVDYKQNYLPYLTYDSAHTYSYIGGNPATPYQFYLDGNVPLSTSTYYATNPTTCEWGYYFAYVLMNGSNNGINGVNTGTGLYSGAGYSGGAYKYMCCVPSFNPQLRFPGAGDHGWDSRDVNHPAYSQTLSLPDGANPRYVPFFSYNGPGTANMVFAGSQDWTNPIDLVANSQPTGLSPTPYQAVSCLRPEYGYINADPSKKVYGSYKLIDCPNYYQVYNSGTTYNIYGSHGTRIQYIGPQNSVPTNMHFRNYGWTDGHVKGLISKLGY